MHTRRDDDDDDSLGDDPDAPDAADQDVHDDPETAECPFCGAEVSELADVCPKCGNFMASADAPRRGKPWWVIAIVVALLAAMIIGGVGLF